MGNVVPFKEKPVDLEEFAREVRVAQTNTERYRFGRDNGHFDYVIRAKLCEDMYLGGGRQWEPADRQAVEGEGRPVLEINQIMPIVNTIIGIQIQNRMDITFLPKRDVQDQETAKVLAKVALHILDQNDFHWSETQVFTDGVVQQRGYYDVRMTFDDNLNGEVDISVLDPTDVIPCPGANSYETKDWPEVTVTRWWTLDQIRGEYGDDKADRVEMLQMSGLVDDDEYYRNSFMNSGVRNEQINYDEYGNRVTTTHISENFSDPDLRDPSTRKVRLLDRQHRERVLTKFFVNPDEGDMRQVPDSWDEERVNAFAEEWGLELFEKVVDRVRWTVTTGPVVLFDDWSPYKWFTVVPFFAYFRRGKTVGAIDNLISPQQQLNKMSSQALHIANTSANSGWMLEEDSLGGGMTIDDLERGGAKSGLVIQYRRNRTKPEKIQPNKIPTAVTSIIERAYTDITSIAGMSPVMQGDVGDRVSGYALKIGSAGGMTQLSPMLDNLSRTRKTIAMMTLDLVQEYYTDEQLLLIQGVNPETGQDQLNEVAINQPQEDGSILNDLTIGEYSVVIQSVPARSTFENGEFQQMMEMRGVGVEVPGDEMILRSNISNKAALSERMRNEAMPQTPPEVQEVEMDTLKAELALLNAKVQETLARGGKTRAEGARAMATATNNSIEAAAQLAISPDLASIADTIREANISPATIKQIQQVPLPGGDIGAQGADALGSLIGPGGEELDLGGGLTPDVPL